MRSPLVRYMVDAVLVAKLSEDGACGSRRVAMAKDRMIGCFHELTESQQGLVKKIVLEMERDLSRAMRDHRAIKSITATPTGEPTKPEGNNA